MKLLVLALKVYKFNSNYENVETVTVQHLYNPYQTSQTLADILHGPSMFAVRAKIYGVIYNQASSIAFDETSSYWSALKRS